MNNYQFRTNWLGQLILQRHVYTQRWYGDKYYAWQDATAQDLKDYYEQLYTLQKPPVSEKLGCVPNAAASQQACGHGTQSTVA